MMMKVMMMMMVMMMMIMMMNDDILVVMKLKNTDDSVDTGNSISLCLIWLLQGQLYSTLRLCSETLI